MLAVLPGARAVGEDTPLLIHGIDDSDYPRMAATVSLPPGMSSKARPTFAVTENGREVDEASATALDAAQSQPLELILVVDVSGSMEGKSLESAKGAARAFVQAAAPSRVAIIAFSTGTKVVAGFAADDDERDSAIAGLEAQGETALYDALVTAADLARQPTVDAAAVVLLSDGGDTVSRTSFDTAVKRFRAQRLPVFAVALKSDEADPEALALLARQSGGRLTEVSDVASLPERFTSIAEELQQRYRVNFTSARPPTKDLEITISGEFSDARASATTVIDNPLYEGAGPAAGRSLVVPREDFLSLTLAVLLASGSVALLAAGGMLFLLRPRTTLDQLQYYEQLQASSDAPSAVEDATGDGVTRRMMDAVGYVAGKRGLTLYIRQQLERAGMQLRPVEYMTIHLAVVVGVGLVAQFVFGRLGLSFLLIVIATVTPIMIISGRIARRRMAFEDQLPDILNLIAGSLRAGWGMLQSLDLVVQETMPPASEEFSRVRTESRLGMTVEDSLKAMAERVDSDDMRWAVSAIAIQREVGGNLAEVLDIVARTIRDRGALRRQIKSLTAEGRLSAYILIALPFFEALVLYVMNPSYIGRLFTTVPGIMIALFGIALLLVGSIWLNRAMRVEV